MGRSSHPARENTHGALAIAMTMPAPAGVPPLSPVSSTTRCITIPVPCHAGLGLAARITREAPVNALHGAPSLVHQPRDQLASGNVLAKRMGLAGPQVDHVRVA